MVYHTAMKIFGYQTTHSAFFCRVAEYFYEFTMAHDVQEAFRGEVNYILVALFIVHHGNIFSDGSHSLSWRIPAIGLGWNLHLLNNTHAEHTKKILHISEFP